MHRDDFEKETSNTQVVMMLSHQEAAVQKNPKASAVVYRDLDVPRVFSDGKGISVLILFVRVGS